jgi:plasmid rolling circle replication initiator protein Rep
MTKVNSVGKNSNNCSPHYLDTLAHLDHKCVKSHNINIIQTDQSSQKKYQNRARSKAFTDSYLYGLIDLKSSLQRSYFTTHYCSRAILLDEDKARSTYCKQRWCLVCNRVRIAKVINDYYNEISNFNDPYFLTLTIPNVKENKLKPTITKMIKDFSNITRRLKRGGDHVRLLRKYECTYNQKTNEFHPHFHAIVESKKIAELYQTHWLNIYDDASIKGQDIRPANENSMVELCKYFTKIIAKDNDLNLRALDTMFISIRNKRTFQAIGIRSASTKSIDDEFKDMEIESIDHKRKVSEIYVWEKNQYDWISSSGEVFADYNPTNKDKLILGKKYHSNDIDNV